MHLPEITGECFEQFSCNSPKAVLTICVPFVFHNIDFEPSENIAIIAFELYWNGFVGHFFP